MALDDHFGEHRGREFDILGDGENDDVIGGSRSVVAHRLETPVVMFSQFCVLVVSFLHLKGIDWEMCLKSLILRESIRKPHF